VASPDGIARRGALADGGTGVSAASIAKALGGHPSRSGWWSCKCPICQGENKLGLRDGSRGLSISCFRGCARPEILTELRRRGLYDPSSRERVPELTPEDLQRQREAEEADRARRIINARDIWWQTEPADYTLVDTYLGGRRILIDTPPVIRLHRSLWHSESRQRRPAMIARVDHVNHIDAVGIHATFLAMDGSSKASVDPPRKSFGPILGAAVHLAEPRPGEWLITGEGIESVASVMQCTGLPGWAALSAPGVESLVLPPAATKIIIAADNDENGRGQQAARNAAARWLDEGRIVKIAMPPLSGSDWNDCLMGRAPARILEGERHGA
jgi:hypothetical protein